MERTRKAVQILVGRTVPHALPLPPFLHRWIELSTPSQSDPSWWLLESADERPLRILGDSYRAWGSELDSEAPATVARWIRAGWELERLGRALAAPAP